MQPKLVTSHSYNAFNNYYSKTSKEAGQRLKNVQDRGSKMCRTEARKCAGQRLQDRGSIMCRTETQKCAGQRLVQDRGSKMCRTEARKCAEQGRKCVASPSRMVGPKMMMIDDLRSM